MEPLLQLAETRRFFTRDEARSAAYDDKAVAAAVRGGAWHRIRRGYFTFSHLWAAAGPEERHRIRSAAVMHSLGDRVALSHVSAVVHHGLSVWGMPLDHIHVTRLDGGPGRVEGDVVHHEGVAWEGDVVVAGGLRVTTPVRAALEAASRTLGAAGQVGPLGARGASALVTLDSLLRTHPSAPLAHQFERMSRWPFMRSLHVPVRMADGAAGSAGESVGRWAFWSLGLPAPLLQHEVREPGDPDVLIGITDWAWPEHETFGEFDGRVKYGRLLRPGQDPGDVVFAEKQREDRIREVTGWGMVRFVWADWGRPQTTGERVRRRLRIAS